MRMLTEAAPYTPAATTQSKKKTLIWNAKSGFGWIKPQIRPIARKPL